MNLKLKTWDTKMAAQGEALVSQRCTPELEDLIPCVVLISTHVLGRTALHTEVLNSSKTTMIKELEKHPIQPKSSHYLLDYEQKQSVAWIAFCGSSPQETPKHHPTQTHNFS